MTRPASCLYPCSILPPSSRPFRDKPEDAIILFSVLIEDVHPHAGPFHFPETRPFTFIVHRRALLAHIPDAHRAYPPFCPDSVPRPVHLPWTTWGVAATRWFQGDFASMGLITTTAGQPSVTMEEGAPTPISVRDFNPYAVRAAQARAIASGQSQRRNWSEQLPNGNRMALKVEDSVLAADSVFKDDVRSSLPYVEIVTQAEYRYESVLIDEERILGLKVCRWFSFHCRCVSYTRFPFLCGLGKKTSSGFLPLTFTSWGNSSHT